MSWARSRSRSGYWPTSSSSSPTSSALAPRARSRLDALLERLEPKLLEPVDLGLRPRLVGELGQGRPPPERESLPQHPVRLRRGGGPRIFATSCSKRCRSNDPASATELVRGRHGPDHVATEHPAELRDVRLENLRGRGRRPAGPELLDQQVARDRLVGAEEQDREQGTRLWLHPAGRRGPRRPPRAARGGGTPRAHRPRPRTYAQAPSTGLYRALDRGSTGLPHARSHRRTTHGGGTRVSTSAGHGKTGPYADRTTRNRIAARQAASALGWRRLAFAALVAAFAAWLLAGTGSDARTSLSRVRASRAAVRTSSCRAGVCRVRIEAAGASGGLQGAAGTPGLGARVAATLRVSPAETLLVHVGGQGGTAVGATPGRGGWNGGGDGGAAIDRADGRPGRAGSGGGGATDVRRGAGTARRPHPGRRRRRRRRRRRDRRHLRDERRRGRKPRRETTDSHRSDPPIPRPEDAAERRAPAALPARNAPDGAVTATGGSLGCRRQRRERRRERRRRRRRRPLRRRRRRHRVPVDHPPPRRGSGRRRLELRPSTTSFRSGVWGNLGNGSLTISYDLAADSCAEQDIESCE